MRALNRRFRALGLRTRDEGLSLTELLVGMGLTTLLMLLVGSMFVQLTKITTTSTQTQNMTQIASNAANAVSSVLGTATTVAVSGQTVADSAIVAGTRSSLTVYSYTNADPLNPAPVRVDFTLDSTGKLTETRCTAKRTGDFWTFGTCAATSTRVVASNLQAPSGTVNPLFTYRNSAGQPIVIGTGSLSTTDRPKVSSIVVEITVLTSGSRPSVIQNTIVLRNIGLDTDL